MAILFLFLFVFPLPLFAQGWLENGGEDHDHQGGGAEDQHHDAPGGGGVGLAGRLLRFGGGRTQDARFCSFNICLQVFTPIRFRGCSSSCSAGTADSCAVDDMLSENQCRFEANLALGMTKPFLLFPFSIIIISNFLKKFKSANF